MIGKPSIGSRLFDVLNYFLLGVVALTTTLPFVYIISGSLTTSQELLVKKFVLIPTKLSLDAYRYIFSSDIILQSLLVSIFITVVGTLINLTLTCLMAYPLAKKTLMYRSVLMKLVVFTMLFSGGLIPSFITVKMLGLLNSYWALWLPGAISAFNLILLKNFFQDLPDGIEESAKIDGCNDLQILWKIVLPLSLPALATFALFYAVGHWNNYFSAIMYVSNAEMWPVQVWLRQVVILSTGGFTDMNAMADVQIPPESIKLAVIAVATVPVLVIYPFLQKHFAKGVLMGSVKG